MKKVIRINAKPLFDLSPWLYMQFMEPLGCADGSVEAAWDHRHNKWCDSVVNLTKELSPTLLRWGGILSAYYHWREGIGDRKLRKPFHNIVWSGIETSQIGTGEFCEFCEMVEADKLFCVNFLSEGVKKWHTAPDGSNRIGDAKEAYEWVDYCNNPDNSERRLNGRTKPYNVKLWQIGNETSYQIPCHGPDNGFTCEEAAIKTIEFADAMRKADPSIELIGWGDTGWARRMLEIAGDRLQYIAFHSHPSSGGKKSVLRNNDYRKDWDLTWEQLMNAWQFLQKILDEKREEISGYDVKLAMTEGHFSFEGRNRCELLSTWAAGVANARALNIQERNGDILKIATLSDFCGTRWMVNALYIEQPSQKVHLMPVGHVMKLYRNHVGTKGINVTHIPDGLDISASRDGNKIYLHVVNICKNSSVSTSFDIEGFNISGGRVFTLQQEPGWEIMTSNCDQLKVEEYSLEGKTEWSFPPASVSAVELDIAST